METIKHELPPIYNKYSKILILGSIPSRKSREVGFYYGHPQNRFWKVLEQVYQEKIPNHMVAKKEFLYRHSIALWDVLASCEIEGSADASIQNPVPNPINQIIQNSQIQKIYTTGRKAYQLYQKYCYPTTKIEAILLPSTSPANATKSLDELVQDYSILKE